MRAYVLRRILLVIPTVLLVTLIVFILLRLLPGDVLDVMVAELGDAAGDGLDRETLKKILGIDGPLLVQYGRWLGVLPQPERGFSGLLQGNLGVSLFGGASVSRAIMTRFPVTFELGLLAMTLALVVAIPVGVYSAIRQETLGDYAVRSFALFWIAVPNFWIGTLVVMYGSIWFGYAPPIMLTRFLDDPIANLKMFIVPATIIGMAMSAGIVRMTRTTMLEVLRQDYIRTAWSKGLKERVVVFRHCLKNALIPVVTVIGFRVPILIGGAVIMERIFNLPGLGRFGLSALERRDYAVTAGLVVFGTTFVVVVNLIVDLVYAYLDPRVKYR